MHDDRVCASPAELTKRLYELGQIKGRSWSHVEDEAARRALAGDIEVVRRGVVAERSE